MGPEAKSILRAVCVSLLIGLATYIGSKLDWFGSESGSGRMAEAVAQRVSSGFYPRDKGQAEVRVVYLDDITATHMRDFAWNSFPPPPSQQAEMIDDIIQAFGSGHPRAVFLDFLYFGYGVQDPKRDLRFAPLIDVIQKATKAQIWSEKPLCQSSQLVKIACIVRAGGVPVIIGKPKPFDEDAPTPVQTELDRVAVLSSVLIPADGYPLVTRDSRRPEAEGSLYELSPAMSLYVVHCLGEADACGVEAFQQAELAACAALGCAAPNQPDRTIGDAPKVPEFEPMTVVWGSRSSALQRHLDSVTTGRSTGCRDVSWLKRLAQSAVGERGVLQGDDQACMHTVSLGYDRIARALSGRPGDLEAMLADKFVLVGMATRGGNDWVDNPVHGQVPGVFEHAMALDNLLQWGPNYRHAEAGLDSDAFQAAIIVFFTFSNFLLIMVRNGLHPSNRSGEAEGRLTARTYLPIYGGMAGIWVLLISLTALAGIWIQRLVSVNWLAVAGIIAAYTILEAGEMIAEDIGGSLRGHPVGGPLVRFVGAVRDFFRFKHTSVTVRRLGAKRPAAKGETV